MSETPVSPLHILIIANDALTRAGLSAVLSDYDDLQTVGQVAPDEALEAALDAFQPDIILWDLGWAESSDLELIADFVQTEPADATIPLLCLVADPDRAVDAWQSGARAVILRSSPAPALAAGLVAAAQGLAVLAPQIAPFITSTAPASHPDIAPLTPREEEVLRLMAKGLPNKSIARTLNISEHTVKFHVNALLGKLGAQSRTEAVVIASRAGLVLI